MKPEANPDRIFARPEENAMRHLSVLAISVLLTTASFAGEAEVKAAQSSIDAQLRAFLAGDNALAYSYAAPNIQGMFPTVEAFMGMVANGYQPVAQPKEYTFGAAEEPKAGSVMQQVMIVGPDGKNYEAVYTLELQPDGAWRITSVRLRVSNMVST